MPSLLLTQLLRPLALLVAAIGAVASALVIGIPTDVVPNPWFKRMTPIEPEQYAFWILTSLLTGTLLATYLPAGRGIASSSVGGGVLGILAVGCPICNKAIVALLGVSGTLNLFAPVQPVIGALGVAVLGAAVAIRARAFARGCAAPAAR
jgi:hypothetical protein